MHSSAGAVTVTSTGNITTAGGSAVGIFASSNGGAVAVTSTGDISTVGTNANGIIGISDGAGPATVTSTGNITTAGNGADGIYAKGAGALTVTSTGNISTAGNGAFRDSSLQLWRRRHHGDHRPATSPPQAAAQTGIFAFGGGEHRHGDLDRQHFHRGQAARNGDWLPKALAPSRVTSTGNISTAGGAHGIFAFSAGGATSR